MDTRRPASLRLVQRAIPFLLALSALLAASCGKSAKAPAPPPAAPPLPPGIVLPGDRTIGAFVALADPKHTGIQALPESIGDGDNAETNLYWGNDEGLKGVFDKSRKWKLTHHEETPRSDIILSTRIYRRTGANLVLIAKAYRGAAMRTCVQDFEDAVARGDFDLVVFIGHDGLMDFQLPIPAKAPGQKKTPDCIGLCCLSEDYMKPRLLAAGGRPALLTTQRMYPGAFILEAVAETWNAGKSLKEIRDSAAASYALNQRISRKAALGVFTDLKEQR